MQNLGKKAKDKVTGFEGVIVSKHSYLTGCSQYGVQPKIDDKGVVPEMKYFDEHRLEITDSVITVEEVSGNKPGCDFRDHPGE